MKRSFKMLSLLVILSIMLSLVLISATTNAAVTGILKIHMISTGDGRSDCFLLELPNGVKMVVDIGGNGYDAALRAKLNELGFGGIRYLVGTHNHADHLGDVDAFMDSGFNINNTQIYYPKGAVFTGDADYNNMVRAATDRSLTVNKLVAGDTIVSTTVNDKPFYVKVISPEWKYVDGAGSDDYPSINAGSLCLVVKYGNKGILMMADAFSGTESNILNGPYASEIANCQVIKVGHHGTEANGATSCSNAFLEAAGVTRALITNGNVALNTNIKTRLQAHNIRYWGSGTNGSGYTWLSTDGTNDWVESRSPAWPK